MDDRPREKDRGLLVLLAVFLMLFPFLFKPWIHGFDTVAYYSWLRTVAIDRNLDVGDEFSHFGYGLERGRTPTGYTYNEWAVGSAILWSPFFLLAHVLVTLADRLGFPVAADGYGAPYIWAVSLGSAIYAFIGIILTYRLCCALFSPSVSVLATLAVWLSSPLVFYMYSHPIMSHANDTFAYALYLYTWFQTREDRSFRGALLRGATAGLCALVRQINAMFVCFPLAEFLVNGIRSWQRSHSFRECSQAAVNVATFSLAWWVVYLPQVIVWRVVFGRWIELNPYASSANIGFDWLHPHFLEVLFSTNRGLFVWSPLLLFAAIGWGFLWQHERRLSSLISTNFVLQLSLIATWEVWNAGASFGQRFFTNAMPAFSLGLAALIASVQKRVSLRWLIIGCAFFIVWNGLLIMRYALEDIPRAGSVPLKWLLWGQFTVLPRYWLRIVEVLLRRF
jgi:hypothetical protein